MVANLQRRNASRGRFASGEARSPSPQRDMNMNISSMLPVLQADGVLLGAEAKRPAVIFDTDIRSDCDAINIEELMARPPASSGTSSRFFSPVFGS